ncbi:MAG TPA: peptidoglycan-binding domain-containing protein [Candidatus Udaeobacter sp.]|nr:peptidoglycan-binding domain-containing protein [Candidatus Udaeobacter sp.]
MRTFLSLLCSVALACSATAAQKDNKQKKQAQKSRQPESAQRARPATAPKKAAPDRYQPVSRPTSHQNAKARQQVNQSRSNVAKKAPQKAAARNSQNHQYSAKKTNQQIGANSKKTQKSNQKIAAQNAHGGRYANNAAYSKKGNQSKVNKGSAAAFKSNKKYRAQRFNLASNTRPTKYKTVKFQQNRRIQGSQYWKGNQYWAFRNYNPVWHDRVWWRNHYKRIVFVYGGWYYWNSGWWYPAWGYAPDSYYAYDGPIYAYNSLPPDQVVANVQAALQEQGYYRGEVDGLLGPLTREAIAGYQRDHGLYLTSSIDEPTLASLGMT